MGRSDHSLPAHPGNCRAKIAQQRSPDGIGQNDQALEPGLYSASGPQGQHRKGEAVPKAHADRRCSHDLDGQQVLTFCVPGAPSPYPIAPAPGFWKTLKPRTLQLTTLLATGQAVKRKSATAHVQICHILPLDTRL